MSGMKQPVAEIFSQGNEVVTGEIADTNAAWLAAELTGLGFRISRHTAVGDRLEALVGLLREVSERADVCICTGGLGPTCDDLTAEAVSMAFDLPLCEDDEALLQIEGWFQRMDRVMPAINRKQALLPSAAERIDNRWGTAPGFSIRANRCQFFFLPGVPREMKAMYSCAIRPVITQYFDIPLQHRIILRTVGLGESTLQERLDGIDLPQGVELGFRTGGAENQVKLGFPPECSHTAVEEILERVGAVLGSSIYATVRNGEGPASLPAVITELLAAKGNTVYVAETISGGLLATRCAEQHWIAGSLVEPVPARMLTRLDIRSGMEEADSAIRLASELRIREHTDYALVQFGDYSLTDLLDESVHITAHFALSDQHDTVVESRKLSGHPERKRDSAAVFSLDFLRRRLAGIR